MSAYEVGSDKTAAEVTFTPAGDLDAENVQDALEELDMDKAIPVGNEASEWDVPTDGTTDATSAIVDALAGAAADTGLLEFVRGTYVISDSLDIPSDLDVNFNGSTLFMADGTDKTVTGIRFMGVSRSTVRNVTLDCNRANRTPGSSPGSVSDEFISGNGVTTRTDDDKNYAADIELQNLRVLDPPNHGFEIVGAERVRIINCYSEGPGDDCFSVGGKNAANDDLQPSRMVVIEGCIAKGSLGEYSSDSNGFEIDDGANHVTVTGCIAEGCFAGGFDTHSHSDSIETHDIAFVGCIARANSQRGITVEGAGTTGLLRPYNVTVSGCTVSGSGLTSAIRVLRSIDVVVVGNVCKGNLIYMADDIARAAIIGNNSSGITVESGSDDCSDVLLFDNTVYNAAADGIKITSTSGKVFRRVIIRGNSISTTVAAGIKAVGADLLIEDNQISGHGTLGIWIATGASDVTVKGNNIVNTEGITTANTECILTVCRTIISGNHVVGGRDGIRLNSGASDSVIADNIIKSPGSTGINLVAVGGVSVTGNRIITAGRGIDGATSGTDVVIASNIISGMTGSSPNFAIRQQSGVDRWMIHGNNYRGIALSLAGTNNILADNDTGVKLAGYLPLGADRMWPSTTNGAAANAKVETSTNKQNVYVLDFADGATKLFAEIATIMPLDWDGGTVTATFYWLTNGTGTQAVAWGCAGRSYGDQETLDQAWGTEVTVLDNGVATANQVLKSSASAAIILSGTPAAGEYVQFRVSRDPNHGSDTLAQTARLLSVMIAYTRI